MDSVRYTLGISCLLRRVATRLLNWRVVARKAFQLVFVWGIRAVRVTPMSTPRGSDLDVRCVSSPRCIFGAHVPLIGLALVGFGT